MLTGLFVLALAACLLTLVAVLGSGPLWVPVRRLRRSALGRTRPLGQ